MSVAAGADKDVRPHFCKSATLLNNDATITKQVHNVYVYGSNGSPG